MIRVEARTARKLHRCDSCGHYVEPGERYLYHVASPKHDDLENPGWWMLVECVACATRYGRANLLLPADLAVARNGGSK